MKNSKLKEILDKKYECYILIGQEKEFGETDLFLNAFSLGIISLLSGAFDKYEPLKKIAQSVLTKKKNKKSVNNC